MKESVETKIKHWSELEGDKLKKLGQTRCDLRVEVKESIEVKESVESKMKL